MFDALRFEMVVFSLHVCTRCKRMSIRYELDKCLLLCPLLFLVLNHKYSQAGITGNLWINQKNSVSLANFANTEIDRIDFGSPELTLDP